MTVENFIPPRSKSVLEIGATEDSKENFLAMQPECDYKISKTLPINENKFDTIILQNDLIGNLEHGELVELIKKSAEKLNPRGTLIFTLDNVAFAENVMAILKGEPLKFKVSLTLKELEAATEEAGAKVYRPENSSKLPKPMFLFSRT